MRFAGSHAHQMLASSPPARSAGLLQRQCACGTHALGATCGDCASKQASLQRKPRTGGAVDEVPPIVHAALRSPGRPLDMGARAFMESRFGHDFSDVRLHIDELALESAAAIDAHSYTVGRHIVFGRGGYSPNTLDGRRLLAHELTHVVQQNRAGARMQTFRIGAANSAAEREAETVANSVAAGGPASWILARPERDTIRRSTAGAVGGTVVGAGAGAALGTAIGGPIGGVVGGVLGGLTGLIAGETLTADKRELTADEKREARIVFGTSLNYDVVRVAESPIVALGGYARTPFNTVYFPSGTLQQAQADPPAFWPWLVHELTHTWQTQHGISVVTKILTALRGSGAYEYGGPEGLRAALAQNKRFLDFNTEQQADICKDYYVALKSGGDVSAYEPYIQQVKRGGAVAP
jgi:outer membrane lipoprotein SlyB